MILFGDQSQNIYDRPSDSRESPIALGFGSWVRLTKSYRSAADAALLDLFRNFQMQHLIRKYADSEIFDVKATQASMRYDLLNYETYGKELMTQPSSSKKSRITSANTNCTPMTSRWSVQKWNG